MFRLIASLVAVAPLPLAHAQLVSDPDFDASVANPAFAAGEGPMVLIDEGHNNWHTGAGRYKPFADVLRNDGYRVAAHQGAFTAGSLQAADIVVIASAIPDGATPDPGTWELSKSAFSRDEIAALVDWVHGGGSLFLTVDYMPLAGWSADLAAGFGIHVADGYAYDADGEALLNFSKAQGTLRVHAITEGRSPAERIDAFQTFAGTALLVPYGAEPLLVFGRSAYVVLPTSAVPPDTPPPADAPRHSIEGWSQGAVMEVDDGRLAVFGEAGDFSAQRYANGDLQGMNDPRATQNKQFLLNVVHWLSGLL